MKENAWHRRHAVQIVSSLPEDAEDALTVPRLATEFVEFFLAQPERAQKRAVVVLIGGNECD